MVPLVEKVNPKRRAGRINILASCCITVTVALEPGWSGELSPHTHMTPHAQVFYVSPWLTLASTVTLPSLSFHAR